MHRIGFVMVALAATLSIGCNRKDAASSSAGAGNPPAVGTSGASEISGSDRDFLRDIAGKNMAELELGRTAVDRASDAQVRNFAQMMLNDHAKAGDSLKAIASQNRVDLPTELDEKPRDLQADLAKKQGLELDKTYMDAMVDGHQSFVDKLESRIDKTKLSEWKASWTDRAAGEDTNAKVKAVAVIPEKSDNPITTSINQWAADTYPVAYAHLQNAKTLATALKKKTTD
jgi:putative membrane protein